MCDNATKRVWISMVEVEAQPDAHGFKHGEKVFANVFVHATTQGDARQAVADALGDLGFARIDEDSLETWEDRLARKPVSSEWERLAEETERTGTAQFGSFHAWEVEE